MYIPLVPCPSCGRHARNTESACPFCHASLPKDLVQVPSATRRLARGAAFMFASSIALTGCSSDETTTTPPTDAAADDGTAAPKYGLPDTFFDADDVMDDGTPVVKYGGPPVDAGPDTPLDSDDTGSPAPKYGLPSDTGTG